MERINAYLAHDMRTPLQLIYSCAQMIQQELDDPNVPAGKYAQLLMENVECLKAMVAADLEAATQTCDIVKITADLCRRMDLQAASDGITLIFSTNAADFRMRIDSKKYLRMVQNLIANALKFTPGGGTVRVSLRLLSEAVEIAVCDTGMGIDPRMLRKLFDRGESHGGYGLGLGIARKFAQQMGGRIDVKSAPGKGAAFTIHLPL